MLPLGIIRYRRTGPVSPGKIAWHHITWDILAIFIGFAAGLDCHHVLCLSLPA
jgi:hypothetical protein